MPVPPVADRRHGTIENLGVREPRRARRTARRARSARPSTPCSRRRSRVISTRNGPSASASTEPTRCTLTRTSVRSYSTAKAARPGPARRSEARRRVPTDRDELLPQPWKNRPGDRTGARASCVALAHPKRRGFGLDPASAEDGLRAMVRALAPGKRWRRPTLRRRLDLTPGSARPTNPGRTPRTGSDSPAPPVRPARCGRGA
jgi:hypothetical protein